MSVDDDIVVNTSERFVSRDAYETRVGSQKRDELCDLMYNLNQWCKHFFIDNPLTKH